jgi:hypothetical protein
MSDCFESVPDKYIDVEKSLSHFSILYLDFGIMQLLVRPSRGIHVDIIVAFMRSL